jgi:hypothetical protein
MFSLETESVVLTPPRPAHVRTFYTYLMQDPASFAWCFSGATPSFERFRSSFSSDSLLQVSVLRVDEAEPIALLSAYKTSMRDGYTWLSVVTDWSNPPNVLEAVEIFTTYLFNAWPFRRVCLEIPERHELYFKSLMDRGLLVREGALRDYEFIGGQHGDVLSLVALAPKWRLSVDSHLKSI